MTRGMFSKRDQRVLDSLARYPTPTTHELARLMSMDAPSVSRALRSLLRAGKVLQIRPDNPINYWNCGVLGMRVSRWTIVA